MAKEPKMYTEEKSPKNLRKISQFLISSPKIQKCPEKPKKIPKITWHSDCPVAKTSRTASTNRANQARTTFSAKVFPSVILHIFV